MKKLILTAIWFYQKYLSAQSVCRYSPTCSEYTHQAVERFGVFHGLKSGLFRILRCHPWGKAGYDPLPKIGV